MKKYLLLFLLLFCCHLLATAQARLYVTGGSSLILPKSRFYQPLVGYHLQIGIEKELKKWSIRSGLLTELRGLNAHTDRNHRLLQLIIPLENSYRFHPKWEIGIAYELGIAIGETNGETQEFDWGVPRNMENYYSFSLSPQLTYQLNNQLGIKLSTRFGVIDITKQSPECPPDFRLCDFIPFYYNSNSIRLGVVFWI